MDNEDLIFRLKKRAEIRRQIPGRKSVAEGEPDRIADLLDEAATALAEAENRMEEEYKKWRKENPDFEPANRYDDFFKDAFYLGYGRGREDEKKAAHNEAAAIVERKDREISALNQKCFTALTERDAALAEAKKLREIIKHAQKPLEAALEAASIIQCVSDGNYEGDDYFGRLLALRHNMFCAQILGNIEEALTADNEEVLERIENAEKDSLHHVKQKPATDSGKDKHET